MRLKKTKTSDTENYFVLLTSPIWDEIVCLGEDYDSLTRGSIGYLNH
jgi:hypothetical protein